MNVSCCCGSRKVFYRSGSSKLKCTCRDTLRPPLVWIQQNGPCFQPAKISRNIFEIINSNNYENVDHAEWITKSGDHQIETENVTNANQNAVTTYCTKAQYAHYRTFDMMSSDKRRIDLIDGLKNINLQCSKNATFYLEGWWKFKELWAVLFKAFP